MVLSKYSYTSLFLLQPFQTNTSQMTKETHCRQGYFVCQQNTKGSIQCTLPQFAWQQITKSACSSVYPPHFKKKKKKINNKVHYMQRYSLHSLRVCCLHNIRKISQQGDGGETQFSAEGQPWATPCIHSRSVRFKKAGQDCGGTWRRCIGNYWRIHGTEIDFKVESTHRRIKSWRFLFSELVRCQITLNQCQKAALVPMTHIILFL